MLLEFLFQFVLVVILSPVAIKFGRQGIILLNQAVKEKIYFRFILQISQNDYTFRIVFLIIKIGYKVLLTSY